MFRFDLTKVEIKYVGGWSIRYIVKSNDTIVVIVNHAFWWEVERPKNLPFLTAWKLKRSILWEVRRRKKEEGKKAKINLIKELDND